MWMILEGTDYAGKSTLAAELERTCQKIFTTRSVKLLHRGKPSTPTRRAVLEDYVLSVEEYSSDIDPIMISDRWHFGEFTYAPIFRPETNTDGYGLLGKSGWRWTELFLLSRGAVTIWVSQPLDVLMARSDRGDDMVNVSQLSDINDLYDKAMRQSPTYAMQVQPDGDDMLDTIDRILALAIEQVTLTKSLGSFPEYIGPHNPIALLVGDKRNVTKEYGDETLLTFMPVNGNSSEFLLEALPSPLWRTVGMVNGNDMKHGSFSDLWQTLGEPQIIALGRAAERACRGAGFKRRSDVITLPHPAYVRRFRYADQADYGDAILRAATKGMVDNEWQM